MKPCYIFVVKILLELITFKYCVCVFSYSLAEYVMSLSGMSEDNFKEAVTDQYSDLYWDEDLLHEMYEVVTGGQKIRR